MCVWTYITMPVLDAYDDFAGGCSVISAWRTNWYIVIINPWRTCAARVTVVIVSVCVCVCVCLLSHISPQEHLFVLKTLSRTQRAMKVKNFVPFSLKLLCCRDRALPPLDGRTYGRPFFLQITRMRIVHTQDFGCDARPTGFMP